RSPELPSDLPSNFTANPGSNMIREGVVPPSRSPSPALCIFGAHMTGTPLPPVPPEMGGSPRGTLILTHTQPTFPIFYCSNIVVPDTRSPSPAPAHVQQDATPSTSLLDPNRRDEPNLLGEPSPGDGLNAANATSQDAGRELAETVSCLPGQVDPEHQSRETTPMPPHLQQPAFALMSPGALSPTGGAQQLPHVLVEREPLAETMKKPGKNGPRDEEVDRSEDATPRLGQRPGKRRKTSKGGSKDGSSRANSENGGPPFKRDRTNEDHYNSGNGTGMNPHIASSSAIGNGANIPGMNLTGKISPDSSAASTTPGGLFLLCTTSGSPSPPPSNGNHSAPPPNLFAQRTSIFPAPPSRSPSPPIAGPTGAFHLVQLMNPTGTAAAATSDHQHLQVGINVQAVGGSCTSLQDLHRAGSPPVIGHLVSRGPGSPVFDLVVPVDSRRVPGGSVPGVDSRTGSPVFEFVHMSRGPHSGPERVNSPGPSSAENGTFRVTSPGVVLVPVNAPVGVATEFAAAPTRVGSPAAAAAAVAPTQVGSSRPVGNSSGAVVENSPLVKSGASDEAGGSDHEIRRTPSPVGVPAGMGIMAFTTINQDPGQKTAGAVLSRAAGPPSIDASSLQLPRHSNQPVHPQHDPRAV
ncbi:unnamed protein product, partial [Amoebophrya sp. A25]